jgi:hypothetical protein
MLAGRRILKGRALTVCTGKKATFASQQLVSSRPLPWSWLLARTKGKVFLFYTCQGKLNQIQLAQDEPENPFHDGSDIQAETASAVNHILVRLSTRGSAAVLTSTWERYIKRQYRVQTRELTSAALTHT